MATITKSTKFPAQLQQKMFSLVKGHSSVAKMAASEPIPFNGTDVFVFNFASDVSVLGESAQKPAGDATITPVQIRPVKVVYQSRVSNEFIYAAEEAQLAYLQEFADGFAKKLAAGLDKMALHGVNPATGSASSVIGNNHLDYVITDANTVTLGASDAADTKLEEAIGKVEDCNGAIISKVYRTKIANLNTNNARKYPDFAWGACPPVLGGMNLDANSTAGADACAYVGDWRAFRWGFAKEMPLEVIEYGNPDGGSYDLKQNNEVLLRSEAFIGWGILDASSFAKVETAEESE